MDFYLGRLRHSHHRRRVALVWTERLRRRALFVIGGIAVGACAAGLAQLADFAQREFAGVVRLSRWYPLVLTPLGFAIVIYVANRWFPNSQGSGIPQTIAAHRTANPESRQRLVSLRVASGKLLMTVFGLLCGASTGREGPTVQIGAALMFAAGRLSPRVQPGVIVAGSAAGVAAAFNAPLAGIMFGIEEMSRSFERRTGTLIIAAVIAAGLTSIALLGNYAYFGATTGSLARGDWLAVPVCGICGGVLGGLFSRALIAASSAIWRRRFRQTSLSGMVMFAMACGLLVVVCGLLSNDSIYGTGYSEVQGVLDRGETLPWYFVFLKFAATACSSISGIPGGIFSPSLAVGAGLGSNLSALFPMASVSMLILLGMVAYLAGVVQAPMTAFVIVTEMSNDHAMLIPLMAASFIAHLVSRLICREGVYHALASNFMQRHADP